MSTHIYEFLFRLFFTCFLHKDISSSGIMLIFPQRVHISVLAYHQPSCMTIHLLLFFNYIQFNLVFNVDWITLMDSFKPKPFIDCNHYTANIRKLVNGPKVLSTNVFTSNYIRHRTVQCKRGLTWLTQWWSVRVTAGFGESRATSRVAHRFGSDKLYICLSNKCFNCNQCICCVMSNTCYSFDMWIFSK